MRETLKKIGDIFFHFCWYFYTCGVGFCNLFFLLLVTLFLGVILSLEDNFLIPYCNFHFKAFNKLIFVEEHITNGAKGTEVPNTPSSQVQDLDPNTAQVQSIQRLAAPPKMKLLIDRSHVICNRM